jgi:hypothetical protein
VEMWESCQQRAKEISNMQKAQPAE